MALKDKEFYVPGEVVGTSDGFLKLTVDAVDTDGVIYFTDVDGNSYEFDTDRFARLREDKAVVTATDAVDAPTALKDILTGMESYRDSTTNPWVDERLADAQRAVFEAIVEELQ